MSQPGKTLTIVAALRGTHPAGTVRTEDTSAALGTLSCPEAQGRATCPLPSAISPQALPPGGGGALCQAHTPVKQRERLQASVVTWNAFPEGKSAMGTRTRNSPEKGQLQPSSMFSESRASTTRAGTCRPGTFWNCALMRGS